MTGALLLAAVLAGPVHADTTLAVRQGDVVVVEGLEGELTVVGWDRDVLSVERDGRDDTGVTVRRSGTRVQIRPDNRRGRRTLDLVLRVPAGVGLDVQGVSLEVVVEGISGDVTVRNMNGDVRMQEVRGAVDVFTVSGEVRVERVRGGVQVDAQSDEVRVDDVVGDLWVTSGSGDVDLTRIQARRVFAETMSGDVRFQGTLLDGGTYELSSHSGDLDVLLPEGTGAEVSVSTFDGDFESEFPVTLPGLKPGGTFAFDLGGGGATLTLKAFNGEIRLLRDRGGR